MEVWIIQLLSRKLHYNSDGLLEILVYGRCIHRHHPRKVGLIDLFLNLSKLGFVHGTHGTRVYVVLNSLGCTYNLSNLWCKIR